MGDKIYAIGADQTLVPLDLTPYAEEALLQQLLATHPDLLGGDLSESDEPRRWLLVRREMEVPDRRGAGGRWYIDHLFLDQDGVPTLVETKRSSDTRLRREVIGQMLDYAANAVAYWPLEQIQGELQRTSEHRRVTVDETLGALLGKATPPEQFWARVKTNLHAGRIRMIFVADEIPLELRRVIEFLNEQMDPAEVLGLELRQFVGHGLRTLVPRIVGQTAEAEQRKKGVLSSTSAPVEYWIRFQEAIRAAGGLGLEVSGLPSAQIIRFRTGRSGVLLFANIHPRDREILAGIEIVAHVDNYYAELEPQLDAIKRDVGRDVTFEREGKRLYIDRKTPGDPNDHTQWPQQHAWMISQLRQFHSVVLPRVLSLQP